MSKSRVFFIILVAFIVGVFACSFFELGNNLYFFLLIFSLIFLAVFYKNKKIIVAFSVLLFFIFGAWLTGSKIEEIQNLPYAGRAIRAKTVVQKASESTFGQNIIVKDDQKKVNILVQVPKYPEYNYGDLLDINCILKPIENRDADFDYKMYMAKDGVLYQCDKEEIKLVAKNKGNFWLDKIFHVRNLLQENIRKVIPEPEGALASGILFGGSNGLSKEIQNEFSQTGMTHIVAVSGYNVTIIAEYLIIIGIWIGLWRKKAVWFAIVGVVLFVIMIGLPSSAVRAGVMGTLLLWAMKNGRLANSENAIIFAAAVMLFFNPLLLRWDIGFQLSFLATLGIVFSSPIWEKSFIKKNKALGISEIIALSLSAQIFVLPIIAYNFHIVSLISLLANVLILPVVPLSMLLVFLAALSGFVFAPLSMVLAWLAFVPLTYEINVIHILAQFPWVSIEMEKFGVWWIIIYYSILAGGIYFLRRKQFQISNSEFQIKSKRENV